MCLYIYSKDTLPTSLLNKKRRVAVTTVNSIHHAANDLLLVLYIVSANAKTAIKTDCLIYK